MCRSLRVPFESPLTTWGCETPATVGGRYSRYLDYASGLLRIQVYVFDRHVPVRIENLEPPLLFALVGVLIGKHLL